MAEYIERQAAIDALDRIFDNVPMELTTEILQLRRDLRQLPSAEPKKVIGYWVPVSVAEYVGVEATMCKHEISHHVCSECLEMALEKDGEEVLSNYCSNCGADMRGEQDE